MKEVKQQALTEKQKYFVEAHCAGLSPYDAACHAGYAMENAKATAKRLLATPHIQRAIQELQGVHKEESTSSQEKCPSTTEPSTNKDAPMAKGLPTVNAESVVRELAAIGFASVEDICQWSEEGVRLHDSSSLSRANTSAIAEVRESGTARGGVQIKMHSKLRALEMLGRHLGMFSTANAQSSIDLSMPPLPEILQHKLHAVYGDAVLYKTFDYVPNGHSNGRHLVETHYAQGSFDTKDSIDIKEGTDEFGDFDGFEDADGSYDADEQNDFYQEERKHAFFS